MFKINEYLSKIKKELENNSLDYKRKKLRTVVNACGYTRRSQKFIDEFNSELKKVNLETDIELDMYQAFDSWIKFSLRERKEPNIKEKIIEEESNKSKIINIGYDFFKYLFDFGSELEYERFHSALNSNKPLALFLVPQKQDFFSEIVEKILLFELIRKRQYKGQLVNDDLKPVSSIIEFRTDIESDSQLNNPNDTVNEWSKSNVFHFNKELMTNVILGNKGQQIIDSEKFNQQFNELSIYSNKYISKQFFILFHCPNKEEIDRLQKEDMLGNIVDEISGKFPFVFTLRAKHANESQISEIEKELIIKHFKILMEIPEYKIEDEDFLLKNIFIDLEKTQVQKEEQLFLKMETEIFNSLKWGYESDEHIYLKYFAAKTLIEKGYNVEQINYEYDMTSIDKDKKKKTRRPDIYVKNEIIVEIETLRGKSFDNNVYLDLVNNMKYKIDGWKNTLKEVWIVVPGFEIARNYIRLKKSLEYITNYLKLKYNKEICVHIMLPDYQNRVLIPVDFTEIKYPVSGSSEITKRINNNKSTPKAKTSEKEELINFSNVIGLVEEKKRLSKIMALKEKGHNIEIGGILFYGLPGCGKTLLAKAFANQSNHYFMQFTPADIKSVWIGQTQKNIKNIFAQARLKSPSILFIDEIDSIAISRYEKNMHVDQKATINQLLMEVNDIRGSEVIVIAATNMLSSIDTALKRSGRFDWKLPIFPPNCQERADLFEYYLKRIYQYILNFNDKEFSKFDISNLDYKELGIVSKGFTPADIELISNEIKQDFLLEEVEINFNTDFILNRIEIFKNRGLSLTCEEVEGFLKECQQMNVNSEKINFLVKEWDI